MLAKARYGKFRVSVCVVSLLFFLNNKKKTRGNCQCLLNLLRRKESIDLNTKLTVIEQYKGGKKVHMIVCDLKLSHSTVSKILKDRKRKRKL